MLSEIGASIHFLIPWTLVVLAVGYILGRRGRREGDLSGPPAMGAVRPSIAPSLRPAAPGGELDPSTRALIEAELAAGRKIEAIKLLREATGMGLKDAKEAVEDGRF